MYPICPVCNVATFLEVFWIIVAHMSGLLSVNTSMKSKFVRNLVAKKVCGMEGKKWLCGVVVN